MTYKVQDGDKVRDATPDEAARIDLIRADTTTVETMSQINAAARASAITKLAGLGLTLDEIAALVGA